MVKRSTLAVSLVVVLTLLSGCSAVLDDGGNGNGNVSDGNGDSTSDPAEFEYAEGYDESGISDGEAAVESHQSSLIDRGSYTGGYTYTVEDDSGETVVDVENRVDFEGEQGYQRADVEAPRGSSVVETYRNSTTRVTRSEFNNQSSVRAEERGFSAENLTASDPIRPLLLNVSEYDSTVEERDGTPVVVYESSGAEDIDSFYGINESANISAFSGEYVVDSDGVVRSANYEVTYTLDDQERVVTVEYSLSEFGSTSVERPEWIAEA